MDLALVANGKGGVVGVAREGVAREGVCREDLDRDRLESSQRHAARGAPDATRAGDRRKEAVVEDVLAEELVVGDGRGRLDGALRALDAASVGHVAPRVVGTGSEHDQWPHVLDGSGTDGRGDRPNPASRAVLALAPHAAEPTNRHNLRHCLHGLSPVCTAVVPC